MQLTGLNCHLHRGRCFQSAREEYLALWCAWTAATEPALNQIFPEIDGLGVAPIACTSTAHGLLISIRLPPGLAAGKHEPRLKIGDHAWSNAQEFYVDLPGLTQEIKLISIQDGVSWELNTVNWASGGYATLWIDGLSKEADPGNTVVHVGRVPDIPEAVHAAQGQINVRLRPVIRAGTQEISVLHRGVRSNVETVLVKGEPPPIRGLEALKNCSGSAENGDSVPPPS